MSQIRSFVVGLVLFASAGCKTDPLLTCDRNFLKKPIDQLSHIAFGSCSDQNLNQSILNTIVSKQPQLFIYLGDNIYGDTYNMHQLEGEYGKLACKKEFQNLITHVNVIATWDDHDYGHNDVGSEYPDKEESKQIFLQFFGEENNIERQSHKGIYTSYYYGDSAHVVQILLLDLRTFRSKLKVNADGYYVPNYDTSATMLGAGQWEWLRGELEKPAKVRIIGSSTRFATQPDGDECWENFPLETQKMFELIRQTRASGVIFISGDVHFGELCKRNEPNLYPIYDCTASPLARHANEPWPNEYQIAAAPAGYNFGMIDIDWTQSDPGIVFRIFDVNGAATVNDSIRLSGIQF